MLSPDRAWLALFVALSSCHSSPPSVAPGSPLTRLEQRYAEMRSWSDQIGVTRARASQQSIHGLPLAVLQDNRRAAQHDFGVELKQLPALLSEDDQRAVAEMRRVWESEREGSSRLGSRPRSATPSCSYDADSLSRQSGGLELLTNRVFFCFGQAAQAIEADGEQLNRLEVLGRLGQTSDPAKRERLFRSLEPVWQSVNGANEPASPYRLMLRLGAEPGASDSHSIDATAAAFGASGEEMEQWLVRVLETWRALTPDSAIEPWDFYYLTSAASRRLSPRIPAVADLRRVNRAYYRSLGADPVALNVQYDLEARPGKYPVAYTDFGSRPGLVGGRWQTGEPWVFTSYQGGGLDNLAELLHESGHAIHIAAIHTRPAYTDWPDDDTFTEALADLAALELYEPRWQFAFLGDSIPLAESLRAKYAGIVFDVAWGLFEIRAHRNPSTDPNALWTEITQTYFRIKPHPEWSWWAMRGQLIDAPGYLVHYAVGAVIVADLRARLRQLHGSFTEGDPTWYPWVSERIYRFGQEHPARQVLEEFLGRPLSPDALLTDMQRMGGQ